MQFLCFFIIINYNKEQKSIFLNSSNIVTSKINNQVDKFEQYLSLSRENDSLQQQNARLIKKFIDYDINSSLRPDDTLNVDSSTYHLISANICNSTIHLTDNYITLCEGSRQGITPDMGVITQNGLVGIVKRVSENRSLVMSVLHSQTNISCAIRKKDKTIIGILNWKSSDPKILNLESVPKHQTVIEGDTVITSGYSTIFPKGILVGKVRRVTLEKGSNSYTIEVELFNDPSSWDVLYVIKNKLSDEQKKLEASMITDEQ